MSARLTSSAGRSRVAGLFAVAVPLLLAVVLVANLSDSLGATTLLALTVGGLGLAAMLVRPERAVWVVLFLLYTNIPVVASQFHGVPKVIAGAFMLLLGVPLIHHVLLRRDGMRFDVACLLLVAYGVILVAAALGAQDIGIALAKVQTFALEGVILYWLLLNSIRTPRALQRGITVCLAAGAFLGGLTVFQAATGNYDQQFQGLAQRQLEFRADEERGLPSEGGPRMYRSDRAEGPIGDPNRYGQILIVLLPMAWVAIKRPQTPRSRLVMLAIGGAILAGMVLTYSRGAYLGLGVIAVLAAGVGWIRPRVLVVGGALVVILAPILFPTQVRRVLTVTQVFTVLTEGRAAQQVDASIRGRLTETLAAANVYLDHPIIGVGPGQYTPFYSEDYQQNPSIKFRDIVGPRRAHSLYTELAAETGTLGMIAFFSIVVVLTRQLWRQRRRWSGVRSDYADLATALVMGIAAYLTTAVFLHLSFERYYWLLIGLAGVTVQVLGREWARRQAEWPHTLEAVPFTPASVGAAPLGVRVPALTRSSSPGVPFDSLAMGDPRIGPAAAPPSHRRPSPPQRGPSW